MRQKSMYKKEKLQYNQNIKISQKNIMTYQCSKTLGVKLLNVLRKQEPHNRTSMILRII